MPQIDNSGTIDLSPVAEVSEMTREQTDLWKELAKTFLVPLIGALLVFMFGYVASSLKETNVKLAEMQVSVNSSIMTIQASLNSQISDLKIRIAVLEQQVRTLSERRDRENK